MSLSFPVISSGSMRVLDPTVSASMLAMYPATLRYSYVTRVNQFVNDSEQRWVSRKSLFSAVLEYHSVNGYDLSLVRAFFNTMLGKASSSDLTHTFSINVLGTTYSYCVFDQDELAVQEEPGNKYSFSLSLLQVRPN